jgi:DNA-binding transcriptional regulator/RsmH inhibitor MraZ
MPKSVREYRFEGVSSYTLAVDRRVLIPKEHAEVLRSGFSFCLGFDSDCIWILPTEMLEAELEKMNNTFDKNNLEAQFRFRRIASSVKKVNDLDKMGRLLLPDNLIRLAQLDTKTDNTQLLGVWDRLEIWNASIYAELNKKFTSKG